MDEEQSFNDEDGTPAGGGMPSSFLVGLSIPLLLLLPVGFLDLCFHKSNHSRAAKRTQNLMFSVLISNAVFQLIMITQWIVCLDCYMWSIFSAISYLMTKAVNWIFLIHRAKLVQGMSPVLSPVWFERRLPFIVATLVVGFTAYFIPLSFMLDRTCFSYPDTDSIHYCNVTEGAFSGQQPRHHVLYWINIVVDVLWTAFLIALFVIPLRKVYQVNLGRMNTNQLRQRRKLKSLLIWSVIMTVINQVTTIAIFIPVVLDHTRNRTFFLVIQAIGLLNPPINVWSSWLMIGRNRRYLQKCCCCCCRGTSRESIQSRGLTDPRSANSIPKLQSKSTIEMSGVALSTSQIVTPMTSRVNTPVLLQGS